MLIVHETRELRCIETRYSISDAPGQPGESPPSPPIRRGFVRESVRVRPAAGGMVEVVALDVERPVVRSTPWT